MATDEQCKEHSYLYQTPLVVYILPFALFELGVYTVDPGTTRSLGALTSHTAFDSLKTQSPLGISGPWF